MSVKVDEARGDDAARGIDYFLGNAFGASADLDDEAVFDPQIATKSWCSCSIDDRPVLDVDVVVSAHSLLLSLRSS